MCGNSGVWRRYTYFRRRVKEGVKKLKVKLYIETGFGGDYEYNEIIEVDDDISENELDELAYEHFIDNIYYGWTKIEDEDEGEE